MHTAIISSTEYYRPRGINALLYVLEKMGTIGRHKLLKAIYFAEQEFITKEGHPFVGGSFIAMEKGPVHSELYDFIKSTNAFQQYLTPAPHPMVQAAKTADRNELSPNYIKYLDSAIERV